MNITFTSILPVYYLYSKLNGFSPMIVLSLVVPIILTKYSHHEKTRFPLSILDLVQQLLVEHFAKSFHWKHKGNKGKPMLRLSRSLKGIVKIRPLALTYQYNNPFDQLKHSLSTLKSFPSAKKYVNTPYVKDVTEFGRILDSVQTILVRAAHASSRKDMSGGSSSMAQGFTGTKHSREAWTHIALFGENV